MNTVPTCKEKFCKNIVRNIFCIIFLLIIIIILSIVIPKGNVNLSNEFDFIVNSEVNLDQHLLSGFGYDWRFNYGNFQYDNNIKFDINTLRKFNTSMFKFDSVLSLTEAINLKCPEDWGLKGFKLNYDKNNKNAFYEFSCVKLILEDSNLKVNYRDCGSYVSFKESNFFDKYVGEDQSFDYNSDLTGIIKKWNVFRGFKLYHSSNSFYYLIYYCRYRFDYKNFNYNNNSKFYNNNEYIYNNIFHETLSTNYRDVIYMT
jgi:hypothetical protein